jgi:hypothetical protein
MKTDEKRDGKPGFEKNQLWTRFFTPIPLFSTWHATVKTYKFYKCYPKLKE